MTKIIAVNGKKQSGKTTLSNYLHGHEMKRHDIIEKFLVSPEGKLVVNSTFHDDNGKEFEEMGVLELDQQTEEFYQYASRRIWSRPFIGISFICLFRCSLFFSAVNFFINFAISFSFS